MRKMSIALVSGIVLVLGSASQAFALDMNRVKNHERFDINSAEAAEVCAASYIAIAYNAPKDSDEQKGATTLARAWLKLAIQDTGADPNTYIDQSLTANANALYDLGDDTVAFYKTYCAEMSQKLMNG